MVELPYLDFLNRTENMSYIFNQFYAAGKILLSMGLLCVVLWYVLKKMHILKPAIKVFIKEELGGKFDIGRKITSKGAVAKLWLTKERVSVPYPEPKNIVPFRKMMGMSYFYQLRKMGEGQFLPMRYGNPSDEIEVMSENTKAWMINELSEAHDAYLKVATWFEKYQTLISISILVAAFMVLVIFSLGYMEQVISAFNNLVNKMAAVQTIS